MTEAEEMDLVILRATLPPIHDNQWPALYPLPKKDEDHVCIDLEWNRETGALELIGVGSTGWVAQFHWQELTPLGQEALRKDIMNLLSITCVIFHNADADIRKLRENGFPVTGHESFLLWHDTMLAHSALHSEEEHTLEFLSDEYGRLPRHKHLAQVAPREYNAADIVQTCYVWRALVPQLAADEGAWNAYRKMRHFLWLAIESEEAGIRTDPGLAEELFALDDIKRQQAAKLALAYLGWPINLNSPPQMSRALYNLEQLPLQYKKGDGGGMVVTADKNAIAALRRLQGTEWDEGVAPTLADFTDAEGVRHNGAWSQIQAGGNPLLEARFLHMGAQQAISHYIEPCRNVERIFPECRQHVQSSGRHSYTGPAVQQFKGRLEGLIVPDLGTCWVGHDWSQIEVRILAVEALDVPYLQAFARGDDIHGLNARDLFPHIGSAALEEIRRRWIKAFVFRIHYRGKAENAGDIPGTRALDLDVPQLIVKSELYLGRHPALPVYWAEIEKQSETGVVRTFRGRPRRLTSPYPWQRKREACNHPMQGGVADIYVETALEVKAAAPWARLVYGAHDAQWWQVPAERKSEFIAIYAPTVEREFLINGQRVSFPATYKFRDAT